MQHRGSFYSRATADSHCAAQGSRNEMEISRQRSSRDVLLIWLVKLQERVKRVDTFVRDSLLCEPVLVWVPFVVGVDVTAWATCLADLCVV